MASNPWNAVVSVTVAGSTVLQAAPSVGFLTIDRMTISGKGGATAGTLTITSRYKNAPQTIFAFSYPATAAFRRSLPRQKLRGVDMGELTVTLDQDATIAVSASGHLEQIRRQLVDTDDDEYVVLTPTQPDITKPYTGYAYDGQLCGIHDVVTGALNQPRRSYPLGAATAADPFGDQSITVQGVDEVHTIYYARNGILDRWHTTLTGLAEKKWMERIDLGRSVNCNLAWFLDPDLGTNSRFHNPTTFGATILPFDTSATGLLRAPFSPVAENCAILAQGAPTSADSAFLETVVNPMEFEPQNAEGGYGQEDHGGDNDHPACRFDDKHVPRWDFRVGGLEGTHRLTFWTFHRREIKANVGSSGPFVFHTAGPSLVFFPFTRVEFHTLDTPASTYVLPGFSTATSGSVSADLNVASATDDFVALQGAPSPFTGPYVGVVQVLSADPANPAADDFALVWCAKLGGLNRTLTTTIIGINKEAPWGSPPGHLLPVEDETPSTGFVTQNKSESGRPAGWVASNHFLITCKYSDLQTRFTALLASGLMDQTFTGIQAAATANTNWPAS